MTVFIVLSQVYPDVNHIRYSRALRAVLVVNFSDGRQVGSLLDRSSSLAYFDSVQIVAVSSSTNFSSRFAVLFLT